MSVVTIEPILISTRDCVDCGETFRVKVQGFQKYVRIICDNCDELETRLMELRVAQDHLEKAMRRVKEHLADSWAPTRGREPFIAKEIP